VFWKFKYQVLICQGKEAIITLKNCATLIMVSSRMFSNTKGSRLQYLQGQTKLSAKNRNI
jgi:hypothetical protein